jgi:hypothetical protein
MRYPTCQQFARHIGSAFSVNVDENIHSSLELAVVEPYPAGADPLDESVSIPSFSLILFAKLAPHLPQGSYAMEHAALGSLQMFIVPIGLDHRGMRYEAVFNQG